MPRNSTLLYCSVLTLLVGFWLFPTASLAASHLKKLGDQCTANSQCLSNDCEDSDLEQSPDDFCDCDSAADCAAEYGTQEGEIWECVDGINASHDLDYCLSNQRGPLYPLSPREDVTLNPIEAITDSEATLDEVQRLARQSPKLKIRIPGLTFSNPNDLQKLITEDNGNFYINVPFLGEYLAALYKYAVAAASIVAVILIINAGLIWVISGGSSEKIEQAKTKITHAVMGLIIALGSYVLLYTINPELVSFRNLKVLYIKEAPLPDPGDDEKYLGFYGAPELTGQEPQLKANDVCFPITQNSFRNVSWNWGGARRNGVRCHAGIDIYTKNPGLIVAADDGQVLRTTDCFLKCSEGWGVKKTEGEKDKCAGSVIVYHPRLGITFNYGEIDGDKIEVKAGEQVRKGQRLGIASYCGMLHLEVYQGKKNRNEQWFPTPNQNSNPPPQNKCAELFLSTKPESLLNPNNIVKQMEGKFCGS